MCLDMAHDQGHLQQMKIDFLTNIEYSSQNTPAFESFHSAILLLEAGAYPQALHGLDQAAALGWTDRLQEARAQALSALDRPAEAVEALSQELGRPPHRPHLLPLFLEMLAQTLVSIKGTDVVYAFIKDLSSDISQQPTIETIFVAKIAMRLTTQARALNRALRALSSVEQQHFFTILRQGIFKKHISPYIFTLSPERSDEDITCLKQVLSWIDVPVRAGILALELYPPMRNRLLPPDDRDIFVTELAGELRQAMQGPVWEDNYDTSQFGTYIPKQHREDLLGAPFERPVNNLVELAQSYRELGDFYARLANARSKALLLKLVAYRILGFRRVKLPRNTPEYWAGIAQAATWANDVNLQTAGGYHLKQYDLSPMGHSIKVLGSAAGLACTFLQKQYAYQDEGLHCEAALGETVIDAGACWGDTTLYFAACVGPKGKVYAAEFIPSNLHVLEQNLLHNPQLRPSVHIVKHPFWKTSHRKLYYVDWGPGSRVTDDVNRYAYDGVCETLSIDDLVEAQNIERVDFIKMDIEGSEFDTLHGAIKTIQRWRPKLAISLYHRPTDLLAIPQLIDTLAPGYQFYLDHHTIYNNETVLFAVPS